MLLQREQSTLLLVDVQEKLAFAVHAAAKLIDHCNWMLCLSQDCDVPIVISEQYPRGLGHTLPGLLQTAGNAMLLEKTAFSCVAAGCLSLPTCQERKQIVLIGIEAHVCVMQTAMELHAAGKQVYVVADAVSSRSPEDRELALARMRSAGIHIISREMVLFEWIRDSGHPHFKQLSQRYLQQKS